MRKNSKKSKGAAILEPDIQAPTEEYPFSDQGNIVDEPLEPEEVGIKIFIFMPKHSKSARKLAAKQFSEGISEKGTIRLADGQSIKFGGTIKTEMTPALKVMLRDGVFLAGKVPRRS
ncbi:MAG: hypothetical protein WC124_01955 [Desulfoplanes sp.]